MLLSDTAMSRARKLLGQFFGRIPLIGTEAVPRANTKLSWKKMDSHALIQRCYALPKS